MIFVHVLRSRNGTKPRFVRIERDDDIECVSCGGSMPLLRLTRIGIDTCLPCSPEVPKKANVAMHKQAYGYSHDANAVKENCYSSHK